MLDERLYYLSMFSRQNDFTKSLSYKGATKNHTDKNVGECILEICQAVNFKIILFFWIMCCFWYFVSFLKFEIYSHCCHVF